jgi:hypothetical protein
MKPMLVLILSCMSLAAKAAPLQFDTLETVAGKVYESVTVTEKRADGISIRHSGGTARIPHEQLPAAVKKQLGGFDEKEAKEAREADKEALEAAEKAMAQAVARKEAQDADEEEDEESDEAEEDAVDDEKEEAEPESDKPAVKGVEPKNADKLSVKITGSGDKKRHQITAKSGSAALLVRWGPRPEQTMRLQPWETKTKSLALGTNYSVTASEDGKIVDTESSTRKTGLGSDTKLR